MIVIVEAVVVLEVLVGLVLLVLWTVAAPGLNGGGGEAVVVV